MWDALKSTVRGDLISITTALKKEQNRKVARLLDSIAELEAHHKRTGSKKTYLRLLQERECLKSVETTAIEHNLLYLNQLSWQNSLRAQKMLAWRVKKKRSERAIHSIRDTSNTLVYSEKGILEAFQHFYSGLYQSSTPQVNKIESFLKNKALLTPLSEEHKEMMDNPITEEEVIRAITRMKKNKAPGPDGYPVEFYQLFQATLSPVMTKTFNSIMTTGEIPPSWRSSMLIPILKPGKEATACSSYRPIALINVDAKIFTTILSNRLQKIISCYVKQDQTGFIPARSMSDNIRRTLNVIHHCRAHHISSFLLALDFEKAFDSVESQYIKSLLAHMNFGGKFITSVSSLYADQSAYVKINNIRSNAVHIKRGTRQGCPLSPLIFALCMEPFANLVRGSKHLQGVKIKQQDIRISLFADDVVIYNTSPANSIVYLNNILSDFAEVSGLRINRSKSELFPICLSTTDTAATDLLKSFRWITHTWKYLGVYIPINWNALYKENFQRAYGEIQGSLASLMKLPLTWSDRINIIKTFVNSKLIFLLRMLPVPFPKKDIARWQRLFNSFIWNNTRHRTAHRILRVQQNKGSLGIPDVKIYYEAANLATALRLMTTSVDIPWLMMETSVLTGYQPGDLFWISTSLRKSLSISNPFLETTLMVWDLRKHKLVRLYSPFRTLRSIDWKNEDIWLIMKNWASHGIWKIKDIIQNSSILTKQALEEKLGTHLNWFRYF